MKILIDVFGGDDAPKAVMQGVKLALEKNNKLNLALCGKKEIINELIAEYKIDNENIEIVEADDVISNEDVPTQAIKEKTNSSMVVGLESLRKREDCGAFISAGSTGALLVGSLLKVGRIKGIERPALAPILNTVNDRSVMLIDAGANADCKPSYLTHFACMGSIYMDSVYGYKNPRVALLSNGTEDKKGNDFNKEAFALLKEMNNINFVGNMEARDLVFGDFDVVVCDGFTGNVCLKAHEGMAMAMLKIMKTGIKKSTKAKMGALLMKKVFKSLKGKMDYNSMGGAMLMGIKKPVIKVHGSGSNVSFCNAILQAQHIIDEKVVSRIEEQLLNKGE